MPDHGYFENLIWQIADLLRGPYRPPQYERVMMVNLLFMHDDDLLATPGTVRKLLDPACGTGGMLAEAQNYLREHHAEARLYVFGQDSANPKDRDYWSGKHPDFRANGQVPKPCLHGCDAHRIDDVLKPAENRRCWLRAEPTFDGLRQALVEPERRVHIGEEPLQGASESDIIKSFRLANAAWFENGGIEFNDGLVTIIGAKGSGKTALADLIAYAASAEEEEPGPASFLAKARDLLNGIEVELEWADGETQQSQMPGGMDSFAEPRVRYLSQQFVERLCSPKGLAEPLVEEIERVVFSAIPDEDRLRCGSFGELREVMLEQPASDRQAEEEAIRTATKQIADETVLIKSLKDLRAKAVDAQRARVSLENELKGIPVKAGNDKVKAQQAASAAVDALKNAIAHEERRAKDIGDVIAEVERHARQASSAVEAVKARFADLFPPEVWSLVQVKLADDAIAKMTELKSEAQACAKRLLFEDSELQEEAVIQNFRITASDGKTYDTKHSGDRQGARRERVREVPHRAGPTVRERLRPCRGRDQAPRREDRRAQAPQEEGAQEAMTARKQTTRGRIGPKNTTGAEWIGGTVAMPAYVTGEGEPYRPEALFWMGADGAILGSTVAKPGELLRMASESLQSAIEQPMYGRSHSPTRVRVASAELADALRAGHPGLDVVCAPTPELDEMLALMREKMAEDDATEQSYLSPEITPEAVAAFFKAAAALFRAKPWKLVPDDQSLFSVTIEQLGVRDAAMSVIGQMGQSFGLILFSGLDDFEAYLDAADVIELGEQPEMPPHFALNFERGAELAAELRREISEHHWEVAGANAYPWLVAVDEELVARPPTGKEVTMAEAISLALTNVMVEKKALRKAWDGGEPMSRTLSVTTHAGEIEVTLHAPYMRAPVEFDPSHDILADLAALSRDDDEIDYDAREALEDELVRRFAASPEAKDLDEIHACRFVMDLGANYFGHTIATLGATDLREVLFELIPRKVSIEASEARWIVDEVRAFYSFLKREFRLTQADSCLRVLGSNAVKKLEAALSDSSNFGMAKSLFMAGADAGFDMQSKEGIEAWMQSVQGKPLPPSIPLPGLPQPSPKKATKAKKDKRKAARKARKRNR